MTISMPFARPALIMLSVLSLAACSSLEELTGTTESVEYKSAVSGDPLSIPPDLTQANKNTRYVAPEGVARLSDYAARQHSQSLDPADRVLPRNAGMQVLRDGTLRWLSVDESPHILFPQIIEFWNEQGFTIHTQNPEAGLIETDWAENRAKIPEGWLRSALGKVLDQVFDSGERDRFTTRLERDGSRTEIYISHQHMEETPTADGTAFKWVFAKEDPGLNAAMLARLMVHLGAEQTQAAEQVRAASESTVQGGAAQISADRTALMLDEPFDRAWRRVGVAIDSARFTVEDRNRSAGDYYIRYLDTDTGEEIEQQTMFGRLFGSRNTAEPLRLRIHLADQGGSSVITVLDEAGQTLTDDTAKRILAVLADNLKTTR